MQSAMYADLWQCYLEFRLASDVSDFVTRKVKQVVISRISRLLMMMEACCRKQCYFWCKKVFLMLHYQSPTIVIWFLIVEY